PAEAVPVADDPDAVGECVGLLEVLRGQEDGHPVLSRQSCDLAPERASALYVETGRRLVEEEDRRPMGEREREVEPALHTARIAAHLPVGSECQPDPLQQLLRAGAALGAGDSVECALEVEVLAAREAAVERGLLQCGPDRG